MKKLEPKIPGGYINIARKIIESKIWDKPPLYTKVWIYLLTKAQHSQFKGLKRSQLYTSIPEIIEECSWYVGFRKEKPTKDQVFQIIDWLRKCHDSFHETDTKATMITTVKATQGLLITIDNYDFYQNPKNYESNSEDNNEKSTRATREQREPDNTNKNDNNVNNDKNILSIVNKEDVESLEEIENDFKNICHEYYTDFSIGRWTKDQWLVLVDKYVDEIIQEKRYLKIRKNKRKAYVYNSIKNIAHKHDSRNGPPNNQVDNILHYDYLADE
ncbi:hypothetical protein Pryu01_02434 [Paraliobacillus ryukyuensis]|uniref:Uncharacterized protein n=1 Tax=Paraliobacillus ryukyuensis TaxID=200904 RepID=A0A366DVN4_9BACI|nr:hypothetical protein [Paraliobacillus ryukyuensis]RBO93579.1 hypothetical protein DES48_11190 [Paraliobacillus ryukyuensis]